ncbi:hypothetical protein BH20ACT24_BH20ACT24_15130 [soil metagenome]
MKSMVRLGALATALVVLAVACGGDAHTPDRVRPRRTPTGSTPSPTAEALPLGELTVLSGSPDCDAGAECDLEFAVSCPDVREDATGGLTVQSADAQPRGMAMFFSAGRGTTKWGLFRGSTAPAFFDSLRGEGLVVVLVNWHDSWLEAAPGEEAGPARLACRPSTVIRWVHDNVYESLSVPEHDAGVCGFCLAGDSGGASQISYALTHYGLDGILDVVVPSGGPPHAALAVGCLRQGDRDLWFTNYSTPIMDASYGYYAGDGPCARRDESFTDAWNRDSIDSGGSDYEYPNTRLVFLFGERDKTGGPTHATFFIDRLDGAALSLDTTLVPDTGHLMSRSPTGLTQLREVLLAPTS